MDSKNITGIVSVCVLIVAQAAGLYSFISSKINENSEKLVEIEKQMIRIELVLSSMEKTEETLDVHGERLDDLEISTSQNFRKSLELSRELDKLKR